MYFRPHARLLALLASMTASCAASTRELEPELVQPAALPPAPAAVASSPATSAAAPLEEEEDDDRSWFHWMLYGPADEPDHSIGSLSDDKEPWWDEQIPEDERARLAGIFRAKEGWYLGPLYAFTEHSDKDLDGQQALVGPADTIVLPDIDVGSGLGVAFGYRFETMAFELRYLRTEHDSQWLGNDFNVTYESFGIDFKQFFFRDQRIQPFIVLGFYAPELEIENGSFSGAVTADGELEDELAMEAGLGIGIYLTPRIFVGGHALYRFAESYDEAQGVAPKGPIENVDAGGFLGAITLTYTF